jgi:hypothetical protein
VSTPDRCGCDGHGHASLGTRKDWPQHDGPRPLLFARHGLDGAWATCNVRWADHAYQVLERDGEWVCIAEPYSLFGADFADFAFLEEHGYHVDVSAPRARHAPGGTVAVRITRRVL